MGVKQCISKYEQITEEIKREFKNSQNQIRMKTRQFKCYGKEQKQF